MARLTFDQYVVRAAIFLFFFAFFIIVMIPVQILWFIPFFLLKKKMMERDFHSMTPMEWFGKFAKNALDPNN